ncbi:hypothetical protein [Pseudodesulfovibrio sp. S3]|uniref:hypothetical protein n=1 Tax=Pseudodesulfovibrio sp. S3 TaxID=2283629 RepID=UPI0013E3BFAD|nr:hypothetical protein [Pseudodesulfovibrio sp. S3]MCJ2164443.1 hypothetical protein [Pseudodesulfovibrio sp. S3-i]
MSIVSPDLAPWAFTNQRTPWPDEPMGPKQGVRSFILAFAVLRIINGKPASDMVISSRKSQITQAFIIVGSVGLMDIASPFGAHEDLISSVKSQVFPDQNLKYIQLEPGLHEPIVKEL